MAYAKHGGIARDVEACRADVTGVDGFTVRQRYDEISVFVYLNLFNSNAVRSVLAVVSVASVLAVISVFTLQ